MQTLPNGIKKVEASDNATVENFNRNDDLLDQKIGELGTHLTDEVKHVTGAERTAWNAKETSTGAQAKVDTHSNATSVHGATSAATANRIAMRDAAGRMKVAAPVAADDVARKAEVDAAADAAFPKVGGTMSGDILMDRDQAQIRGMNNFLMLSGKNNSFFSGNAYHDGTQWMRYDTALPAVCFSTNIAGHPELRTAPAGANPITWTINNLWHSGNDGAGSGLDADTIDGIDSGRIVYGSNASGATPWTLGVNNITKSGFYYTTTDRTNLPVDTDGYLLHRTNGSGSDSNNAVQEWTPWGSDRKFLRRRTGGAWQPWVELWHSGNDGAGSGLQADTVPGYGIGTHLQNNAVDNLNEVVTTGFYHARNSSSPKPSGVYDGPLQVMAYNDSWIVQILYDVRTQITYNRVRNTGTWSSWKKVGGETTISTAAPSGGTDGDIWIQY